MWYRFFYILVNSNGLGMGNVLVVDDENEICILLSSIMRKFGFDTEYANTLKEGEKIINKSQLDLIFLDLNLPDGVGFELLSKIDKANQKTKVIIISAHDGSEERKEAEERGVDYFLPKPFSKKSVVESLNVINLQTN